MRLFVSIDLSEDLTDEIADLQAEFADADGLRFTDPNQTHVTLKFLGEVDECRLSELEFALETAVTESEIEPFDVEYGGLGVFPSLEYISVLWLGVRDGSSKMTRLHEAVERKTVELGSDPENHEFTPHATIARMDHAGGKEVVQRLVCERDPTVGTTTVRTAMLKKSDLGPKGPVYSTLASISL
jgi:2'-5' RNA ligase